MPIIIHRGYIIHSGYKIQLLQIALEEKMSRELNFLT